MTVMQYLGPVQQVIAYSLSKDDHVVVLTSIDDRRTGQMILFTLAPAKSSMGSEFYDITLQEDLMYCTDL